MKRLIAVLAGLLVLPAFAEVAPAFYVQDLEYTDEFDDDAMYLDTAEEITPDTTPTTPTAPTVPTTTVNPRGTTGRTASRVIPSASTTASVTSRGGKSTAVQTRTTVARPVSSRTVASGGASRAVGSTNTTTTTGTRGTTTATRGTTARTTTSRAAVGTGTVARSTTTTTTNSSAANATRARAATGTTTPAVTARAATSTSLGVTDTVNNPIYTGRVGVRSSATGVASRVSAISTLTTATDTDTTVTPTTTAEMDSMLELTEYCKAQYAACMDNFCNVLDESQGRCSCSSNLKNYEKTEAALKQANTELQNVAQQIQYIGLGAEDVEALFTQTEAELKMQNTTDNSQLKSDLDTIKAMIIDVKTGTATSTSDVSLDLTGLLNISLDGGGLDLSSLFGTQSNSAINNQRGETLYKTAAARCKTAVLNSCAAQGVNTTIVTNAYDLEIDKQCIAYERSLNDANTQMTSTISRANAVLQQARLLVARQKNEYSLKECVTELDNCMQDDFVCGENYKGCLDPSGKFIVNGDIIPGSLPGTAGDAQMGPLYTGVWGSGNDSPWVGSNLNKYIDSKLQDKAQTDADDDIATFLQSKIGYSDGTKTYGMCMYVLNKCQDYTYTGTGTNRKYNGKNQVVRDYLTRTLTLIKAAQDETLSDYAETCVTDVRTCLSRNNITSSNCQTAINACSAVIKTCKNVSGNNQPDSEFVANIAGVSCTSGVELINNTCTTQVTNCLRNNSLATASDCTTALSKCTDIVNACGSSTYTSEWIKSNINRSYCAD